MRIQIQILAVCLFAIPANGAVGNQGELFKRFLQERPEIEKIVFTMRRYSGEPEEDEERVWANAPYTVGRWQSNSWFIQVGFTNVTPKMPMGEPAFGVHTGTVWQISEPIMTLLLDPDGEARGVVETGATMEQSLNFGIPNLRHGSLKWTGDTFKATNTMGNQLTGALTYGANGLPLNLTCVDAKGEWDYHVKYQYLDAAKAYPHAFVVSVDQRNGKRIMPVVRTIIKSLEIAATPLTDADLSPQLLFQPTYVVIKSNDMKFQLMPGNKLHTIKPVVSQQGPSFTRKLQVKAAAGRGPLKPFFFIAILFLLFCALCFVARRMFRRRQS